MATTQQRIRSVTNYSLQYFEEWHRAPGGEVEIAAAQLLLAAGRGPARVHSCEQTLRHIHFVANKPRTKAADRKGRDDFVVPRLLQRALALLRAGELRTLHVTDSKVVEFILSVVVQQEKQECVSFDTPGASAVHGNGGDAVDGSQVLASLRAIEWHDTVRQPNAAFALLEPVCSKHHGAELPFA
jgi:hypothetical protein